MSDKRKVYVVEEGCYSDRHICGIFSGQELADRYIAKHRDGELGYCEHDVHEWVVDEEEVAPEARPSWKAEVFLWDGDADDPTDAGPVEWSEPGKSGVQERRTDGYAWGWSTVSPQHAMKLAVESRQAWLRQKAEGP